MSDVVYRPQYLFIFSFILPFCILPDENQCKKIELSNNIETKYLTHAGSKTKKQSSDYREINIFLGGDVYLGGKISSIIKKNGASSPFSKMKNEIKKCHIAFANLESAISLRGKPLWTKKYLLKISPDEAESLKYSGITVVSVANNHSMDFGRDAFMDTLLFLEKLNILFTGGGWNYQKASKPAIVTFDNISIVFLAFTTWSSPLTVAKNNVPGITPPEIEKIKLQIDKYKKDGSIVLVSIHWGKQHIDIPTIQQIQTGRLLIEAGADAIIGHHPHCAQPIEIYRGKPIFYSLGNLIFGLWNKDNKKSIAAILKFYGSTISSIRLLGIDSFNAEFLSGEPAEKLFKHIAKISKKFGTKIEINKDHATVGL